MRKGAELNVINYGCLQSWGSSLQGMFLFHKGWLEEVLLKVTTYFPPGEQKLLRQIQTNAIRQDRSVGDFQIWADIG